MSGTRGRVIPVLAAAAVLIGGANLAAYAANGHPLILGGDNHEVGTTTVHNSGGGPALTLRTRKGAPPLAVTSHRRVRHLNADQLDGFTSRSLSTRSWTYRIGGDSDEGATVVKTFPGLPPGHYLATYNMVAGLYGPGAMSCWLSTPPSTVQLVYGRATQEPTGPVVVVASGYVDATAGGRAHTTRTGQISMTCQSSSPAGAPAFDTYSSQGGGYDSRVTFTRLDTSSVQWATTTTRGR